MEKESDSARLVLGGRELNVYRAASSNGGFVVVVSDVTTRVRAETMLPRLRRWRASVI